MAEIISVFIPIQSAIFIITILLSLIYLIPILLIRRYHNVNNAFTVNLCFAAICCDTYWLIHNTILNPFLPRTPNTIVCFVLNYFGMMCTFQVPLAIVGVSIHRLCSVVYHKKIFFRRKQWIIICIVSEWSAGIIFPLVHISIIDTSCEAPIWIGIYIFIMIVIIPSLICLIINVIIFNYVRSSTNRTQPISTVTSNSQHQHINRRDLHLLRHMIIMFCICIGGWSPVFLYSLIAENPNIVLSSIFMTLVQLSLLINIMNLFLYNHKLRRYLLQKILRH